jgi:hypothetical protein
MAVGEPQLRDRGQMDAGRLAKVAVAIVVALTVTGLLAAIMLPVALDGIEEDRSETITQDVSETVGVTTNIDSTLNSTNAGTNATYTVADGDSQETNTIAVGSEATYNLDGGNVDVNVSEANSGNATATFTYSVEHGWSAGAQGIWGILAVIITLAVFLFVLGVSLAAMDRV